MRTRTKRNRLKGKLLNLYPLQGILKSFLSLTFAQIFLSHSGTALSTEGLVRLDVESQTPRNT